MQKQIQTKDGIFTYSEIPLYHGRKKIDVQVCKENLLDLKVILDCNGIEFGLIFGTLLGAVRQNNFIPYDEDVDLYVLSAFREKFLALLWIIEDYGFRVARYDGNLLSVIRNDDYIDIYFFKKSILGTRTCGPLSLPGYFFVGGDKIQFLGEIFRVPKQHMRLIVRLYGENWRTPVEGAHAAPTSLLKSAKAVLKSYLPVCLVVFLKGWIRKN